MALTFLSLFLVHRGAGYEHSLTGTKFIDTGNLLHTVGFLITICMYVIVWRSPFLLKDIKEFLYVWLALTLVGSFLYMGFLSSQCLCSLSMFDRSDMPVAYMDLLAKVIIGLALVSNEIMKKKRISK